MMKKILFALIFLAALARADGPSVTIVTGIDAPELERHAAAELSDLLTTLFDATVTVVTEAPTTPETKIIHLGSPATHPGVGGVFPAELGQQGHVVKSTLSGLVIAGGSPVATLWAVYEYGYANGMRYLTSGDFPPMEKPAFTLDGYDIVRKPRQNIRAWRVLADGPASQAAWTVADHEKLLRQLTKLKFNAVIPPGNDEVIAFDPISVSGDIAGRTVFGNEKQFANPELADGDAAGMRWRAGIREAANSLGMDADLKNRPDHSLEFGHDQGGVLPWTRPVPIPAGNFSVTASLVGDINPQLHYLSRAAWDDTVTPESALIELATPICGEGVAETLALGFAAIAEVSTLISGEDPTFAVPDPEMFMEHYVSTESAPEWWAKARELYGKAVGEMYRANTRARDGARPWILYHAKRHTFALHYLTAVEAARNAGIAREAKDNAAWAENLEASIEAMHNALGIYAEVANDPSDRGVIALLNEYGYRPLLEELDKVPLE